MDTTTLLALPYLQGAQAQKHVTINESLAALDALVQLSVLDRDLAAPPASPAEGNRYIVAASATGAWAGQSNHIAIWRDGAWAFYAPGLGWRAWIADENALAAWTGAAWSVAFAQTLQNAPLVGVHATADATNRLSVSSAATLLSHAGAGHQLKLNKAAASDTASVLYQTGFSGRAEFGLTGDDNFHLKVSADGAAWTDVLMIDKTNGRLGLGSAAPTSKLTVSANTAALPAPPSGTMVHLGNADGTQSRIMLDAFNASGIINFRRSSGTAASPAAVPSGQSLGAFNWFGYGTTGYSSSNRAEISAVTAEAWTDTAQGTYLIFKTNPIGAAASGLERMRISDSGAVGIGLTTPVCKLDVDGPARVKSYTVAGVPSASAGAGQIIYVSDETGGAVLAFSDGINWRRVTDRAIVA